MNQNNFNSDHFRFKHTKRCYAMNWTPKRFDDLSSSAVIWNPPPWRDSILCGRNYSRGGDNILCWPNPCKLFLDVVSSPPADNFTTGVTVCGGRKHLESPLDLHVNKIHVTKLFTFRLVLPWNLGWLMYLNNLAEIILENYKAYSMGGDINCSLFFVLTLYMSSLWREFVAVLCKDKQTDTLFKKINNVFNVF